MINPVHLVKTLTVLTIIASILFQTSNIFKYIDGTGRDDKQNCQS